MLKKILISLLLLTSNYLFASSAPIGTYYVNGSILKVRTGPSTKATHSYSIYKKQKVTVYELHNGWARVSKSSENSKWAYAKYLTKIDAPVKKQAVAEPVQHTPKQETVVPREEVVHEEPAPKVKKPSVDTRLLRAISKSDDFLIYSEIFLSVSQQLVKHRICKVSDFRKTRGWMELKKDEIYFSYCGGFNKKNKIYMNLKTGRITGDMRKYK